MSYSLEERRFFKFIRESFFNKKDFKKKLKKSYEENNQKLSKDHILADTSEIIFYLVSNSTKLWKSIIRDIESNWAELYLTETSNKQKEFPKIYKLFNTLHKKKIDSKDPVQNTVNITSHLGGLFAQLVYSNNQSGKSNAGSMFEHHIRTLMDVCNYKYGYQESILDGEVLDFVFPNVKLAKEKPEICLSAECQNTLKDRVRLTQGKLQHIKIQRFLFTASGLNAATKSDHQDLTPNKIKELEESGVNLVVFKKVKEDKFSDKETVFSYEQFFNEIYPNASKNWKKK